MPVATVKSPNATLLLTGPRLSQWWTGCEPIYGECPGVDAEGKIHSLPQLRLQDFTRADVLDYFNNTWTMTEVAFSALQGEEAFYRAPLHGLRHPLVFYYGHPAVLYVNKLRLAGLLAKPVDAHFEQLFETGVDEMSWDDMSKNDMEWPSIEIVREYRAKVYELVTDIIESHPALEAATVSAKPLQDQPIWALIMGFEHERIHFETTTVLMRELPLQFLQKPAAWPDTVLTTAKPINNRMVEVAMGTVEIGKPATEPTFGWDNEYGQRSQKVAGFSASQFLISNAEFLEFVKDSGYSNESLWSAEGWRWRKFRNVKWPTFWVSQGPQGLHDYRLRLIFEVVDFAPSLPAIVNWHEAQAYAKWLSLKEKTATPYRLLAEAEQHRLREMTDSKTKWNLDLAYGSETPVNSHVSHGLGDVFGNVWQWCEDEFNPLPGFRVHRFYEDFSTPCFDGKHYVIQGGSFVSTGDEAGPFARFHFRPHFFQHAGFRIARSLSPESPTAVVRLSDNAQMLQDYESKTLLDQYMLLHFGAGKDVFPFANGPTDAIGFPKLCAEILTEEAAKLSIPVARALDVGCAVGGASFELARTFKHVVGVDLSASFIQRAKDLKLAGRLTYSRPGEGSLSDEVEAIIDPSIDRERLTFRQADAASLPPDFVDFDAVLLANLLCRLPSPRSCLSRMSGPRGVVRKGGLLVLLSPYSWLEQYTPKESWLGGFKDENGKDVRSSDTLRSILGEEFELVREGEVPLLIREHARKYQYIVSHLMVWRRKP